MVLILAEFARTVRTSYTPIVDKPWHLYLIECRNGALYAGITNDLERRYAQHTAGKGARYTRANPPVRLVGSKSYPDKSTALRAEHAIRQLPKTGKPAFLRSPATLRRRRNSSLSKPEKAKQ